MQWLRGWRKQGGFAQADLYARATIYALLWVAVVVQVLFSVTRPVRHSGAPAAMIAASCLLTVAQGVYCTSLASGGLADYLGQARLSRRPVAFGAGLMATNLVAALVLTSEVGPRDFAIAAVLPCAALMPFTMAHSLIVRKRVSALVQLAGLAAVCGAVLLLGGNRQLIAACMAGMVAGPMWYAVTTRCSAWHLGVMWKLHQAKDMEARLAVAEERLRFGRDLHDVMGRNLAVIALKSELAVQLARRGRPESVNQMTEVQRMAHDAQREVREVVRGYRGADLATELAGAQGVLEAAGIECTVNGPPDGLPADVQSALGWVVREAATNVLRHGDARRCTVAVASSASDATLTVENDGAAGGSGNGSGSGSAPGTGLAGLRERLTAVDGTLTAGPAPGGRFRLTAEVPLTGRPAAPDTGPRLADAHTTAHLPTPTPTSATTLATPAPAPSAPAPSSSPAPAEGASA
ncbi:sensor histidine kinase [Streptomyces sp. SID10853]|uniref:sensor histidine kinase n=1 Tax=Streptomyces sp. SID10853 TaxID=2706028 RepID=UPI0013BFE794|nr:histidine kinase [Streptomyces sp. SID10853]NDZ79718.1 sensor histidine kinase [Streptomyces sp. SID10853]